MMVRGNALERFLLTAALFAGVRHAGLADVDRYAVRGTAFAALGFDPGLALLHREALAFHGLTDQPLSLRPHRFFRHAAPCLVETNAGTARAATLDSGKFP